MQLNRAVVWDLDGVIVDSGEAHNRSWADIAAERGFPYDPDADFKATFGRHNTDIISYLWNITDPEEVERIALRKETLFREAARELKPLPGVVELMAALEKAGWKQGIGSSAPLENIELLLSVTGTGHYMGAIASGEDVTRGKPDPAVFSIAFSRLGVEPLNGVVFEDAPAGVRAGIAAGAVTIGITNTQTAATLNEAGATLVVSTLEGITVADLERLIENRQSPTRP